VGYLVEAPAMNAVIVIDKPARITSAEVVRRIKRSVKPARVGHLGTLDPFATGVLPILIGEATKLAPFLEGGDKRYAGLIKLGVETDTLDRDGSIVRTAPVPLLNPQCLAAIERQFSGGLSQVPPVFSAIKRAGVPLYRLARKGVDVQPPAPRKVEIRFLKLETASRDTLRFELGCSAGTYVRSLARDIGVALQSAAHLAELRRLQSGGFSLSAAAPLERVLAAIDTQDLASIQLIAPSDALGHMPRVVVDEAQERRLRNGDSSALDSIAPAGAEIFSVVQSTGDLIAIARATSRVTAVIERIFHH
jgi:tRNA pseudouridine55 synthase